MMIKGLELRVMRVPCLFIMGISGELYLCGYYRTLFGIVERCKIWYDISYMDFV